ncbi:type 4a pilus biogenesis protein PilO [Candidatus Peregrinibacteria bacterium]|nr:type 4a pilus biogenesis protein PilO [Candidatus Peregrinibacteria bacterium]
MKNNQISQLVSIILLLFLILGGVFFVGPIRERVQKSTETRDAAALDLQGLQSQYEELAALAAQVSESAVTKTKLLSAVPVGTAQDKLLDELGKMASDLSLVMNSVSFAESSDQDFGNYLNISANFQGSYDQLIAFLQKLENASRLLRVTALSVQLTGTSSAVFTLSLEAYYQ